MCVYCSKLKENDLQRIYVQINTYRVYIDIHYPPPPPCSPPPKEEILNTLVHVVI